MTDTDLGNAINGLSDPDIIYSMTGGLNADQSLNVPAGIVYSTDGVVNVAGTLTNAGTIDSGANGLQLTANDIDSTGGLMTGASLYMDGAGSFILGDLIATDESGGGVNIGSIAAPSSIDQNGGITSAAGIYMESTGDLAIARS